MSVVWIGLNNDICFSNCNMGFLIMSLKTENLAIVLTDIVGFTKLTARQTRSENEELLATHNRILYPIY